MFLILAPPAPEVQVLSFGMSWIAISWSQQLPSTVNGYVVLVEGLESNSTQNISLGIVMSTNITDLDYGVYRITVRAIGIDGQVSSSSVPVTTSTIIPGEL